MPELIDGKWWLVAGDALHGVEKYEVNPTIKDCVRFDVVESRDLIFTHPLGMETFEVMWDWSSYTDHGGSYIRPRLTDEAGKKYAALLEYLAQNS